jgi:VWFA-related protein
MVRILKVAILFCFVTASIAQNPSDTNQPLTVIRSQSELVLVPVVVTDKNGNPVTGVPRENFTISEDGKPKKIAVYNEVHTSPQLMKPPSLPAGEFTNTVARSQDARITIIMLDMLNTPFSGQVRVRKETLKFLSEHLEPGEPIALLSLGREGLRVLHDFSTDPQVLAKALEAVRPGMSAYERQATQTGPVIVNENARSFDTVRDALTQFANGPETPSPFRVPTGRYYVFGNSLAYPGYVNDPFGLDADSTYQATLRSLRVIAAAFGGLPVRKTLIWATGGIPDIADMPNSTRASHVDYTQYQSTWAALSNANIAVYPLDLSSLAFSTNVSAAYSLSQRPQNVHMVNNLEEFARVTGGRVCIAKIDMESCFRTAARDSSTYYELAYYTEPKGKDGWRRISVNLTPEVLKAHARSGFYYRARSKKDSARDTDLQLATASPIDLNAIPMHARWIDQSSKGKKVLINFELAFPGSAIAVSSEDKNDMQVELFALPKSPDGKPQGSFSQTLAGEVPEAQLDDFFKQQITRRGSLELPPGEYEVRFIVRDSQSGKIGTVTAPLTVAK